MRYFMSLPLLALLLLGAGRVAANPVDCDIPYAAFDYQPVVVKDFGEMVTLMEAQAQKGNQCAQFELGMMYLDGMVVKQDAQAGIQWLRQAAENGSGDALHALGLLYSHGVNLEKDSAKAVELFYKAGLAYLEQGKERLALREEEYLHREESGRAKADELHRKVVEKRMNRRY